MTKNFRVVFYPRSTYNKNKDGLVPIRTRIYLGSERVELGSTGVKARPDTWDSASGRLNGRSNEIKKANNELDRIELDIMHIFRRNEFNDALSLDLIKSEYLGTAVPKESFIDFYKHFLDNAKKEIGTTHSYAYYQKFSVIFKHFTAFLMSKHHRKDLLMTELTYSIISGFENYLMTDGKQSHNTTMRQMRNFKTVVIRAQKMGLLKQDPFVGFKFRFKQVERAFLTDEELKKLMKKEFKIQRLALVRDIFLFSCFTGLAYIDVAHLMPEHIVELDGKQWIMIRRQKTDVPTTVLLLKVPKMILAKYEGVDTKGRLLPILSNQKMNAYLKEIADLCDIKKTLTFHIARHTFATMTLSKGVPVESISRMLGHTNIRTTQIYAKITNKKIEADMLALTTKLTDLESTAESALL